MNLLFLTMSRMSDYHSRGIYPDLLRKFLAEGWNVYVAKPRERARMGGSWLAVRGAEMAMLEGIQTLQVHTLNLQKTSILEKGLGQVLIDGQYVRAVKKYLRDVHFDLIVYSTPPVTFSRTIAYLKRKNPGATTYLLLKDIFPQNAVDMGLMSKKGIKGLVYRYFRRKEKKLYSLSDAIGCMSPANVEYVLKHNPEVDARRVEVAPNSVDLGYPKHASNLSRDEIRAKYGLPLDRPILIYGGNLGHPQGIPFVIACMEANADREDCHFVIVGTGTESSRLKAWSDEKKPHAVTVLSDGMLRAEYDELERVCDIGLVFLDHRFTIPNFPSRLLGYLENKMPVLCATDPATDIGRIAEANGFGYWCESNSVEAFTSILNRVLKSDVSEMGEAGNRFLRNHFSVDNTYRAIVSHV